MADNKKIATRLAFGQKLAEIGAREDIVVLDADLSKSTMTALFKEKYPERHINCGIAEGNMISTAAGMAACGKKVFAASFAMFSSGRAFEQVRNSIAYPALPVVVVGSHAGVTVGEDGATHQAIEDVAIMRSIPGMTVISPADGAEMAAAVCALADYDKPAYLRMSRLAMPIIFDEEEYGEFKIGKGRVLREGSDVTIIGAGLLLHEAVKAADELEKQGISVNLVDMPTIKPIDEDLIAECAKKTGAIVCVEEHSVIGGLGSAVAEVLVRRCPVICETVGVKDKFGCSGKPAELLEAYEMSAPYIAEAAKRALKNKKA